MYTLFVCGAPHNSKGFEYAEIDGPKLPDNISQYIDIYDLDKMKDGRSYIIQKLTMGTRDYTLLGEYVRINPSDQKTSRGSYIAVGILTDEVISLHVAMDYFCIISSLHASLKTLRNDRNAFSTNFKISKNLKVLSNNYQHIPFLANITKEISNGNVDKKIFFNDVLHKGKTQNIPGNVFEKELNQLKEEVKNYIETIHDEKEAHRLTRIENDGIISRLQNDVNTLEHRIDLLNQSLSQKNENIFRLEQNIERLRTENNSFGNQDIHQRGNSHEGSTFSNDTGLTNINDRPYTFEGNDKPERKRHISSNNPITWGPKKSDNKLKILMFTLFAITLSLLWYFDVGRIIGDMIYDESKIIETKTNIIDTDVKIDNAIDNTLDDINISKKIIDVQIKKDTNNTLNLDSTTSTSSDKTAQKTLTTSEKLIQLEKQKKTQKEATKSKSSKNED